MQITIDKFFDILSKKNGTLISGNVLSRRSYVCIRCESGHEWKAQCRTIIRGSWCPRCGWDKKKLSLDESNKKLQQMCELASNKGGRCLSTLYENIDTKLLWSCKFGHEWMAKPHEIKHNSWCPTCASGLYERICKFVFETIFQKRFDRVRPAWLTNSNGNKLELDGYCAELNIAFEHNGMQHYTGKYQGFDCSQVLKDDVIKINICVANGTKLFIIPELVSITPLKELKSVIKEQAIKLKIDLPIDYDDMYIDYNLCYGSSSSEEAFAKLKNIIHSKGGECLSKTYLGTQEEVLVRCSDGHVWSTTYNRLQSAGTWCPGCKSKNVRKISNQLAELIKQEYANGDISLSKLAKKYGVARQTIKDAINRI